MENPAPADPNEPPQLILRDGIFDNQALEWINTPVDEHFQQRHLAEEHPIYCETLMTVRGGAKTETAVTLLSGPWDWWEHGNIADFVRNNDGSSDQVLSPVWWFFTRVGLHIFPQQELPGLNGWRIPILLSGDFTGPSTVDVYPLECSGDLMIRGRFHGVDYNVSIVSDKAAEKLHLDAEAGTMPLPFPKGTGWVGLLHKLEADGTKASA